MHERARITAGLLVLAMTATVFAGTRGTIRFVYIGGSGCGFCKREEYKQRIREFRDAARLWAKEHHFSFESIGVATDDDRSDGERFLADSGIGPYDRIIAGEGWAGADPFTKPYRTTNEMFLDGVPLNSAPQFVLLCEDRPGAKPREALRAIGTMILYIGGSGGVAKVLDRETNQRPDGR